MKKSYIKPEIETTEVIVENSILTASPVGVYQEDAQSDALSKGNSVLDFDVWGEDEAE